MFERILIPVDGSDCSLSVIHKGLGLARQLAASVTFIHALENQVAEIYGVKYGEQLQLELRKQAEETLAEAVRRAEAAGVQATPLLTEDKHPADAILEAEAGHDLVVMGTHGRRGLRRFLLGSVTEEVIRRSDRDHMVVHCEKG